MNHFLALIFCVLLVGLQNCNAIINGVNATYDEFPFMVSLRNETNLHYCGGTLITKKHVLTAAHCIYTDQSMFFGTTDEKLPVESVKVLVDAVSADWDPNKSYEVEKMVGHPQYDIKNTSSLNYDVAIITLKSEVTHPAVMPASIHENPAKVGDKAVALGWGVSNKEAIKTFTTSRWLQKIEVTVVNFTICESKFREKGEHFGDMVKSSAKISSIFCAYKDEKSGTCFRDSGSPILINGELAGHVTFGWPCAQGVPDVYTPIVKHADFINAEVGRMIV